MEDESFEKITDRGEGNSGMIRGTVEENAANTGTADEMRNTPAVFDHGVDYGGCSTGAEPPDGRAEGARAVKYEGDGKMLITTHVAESIDEREKKRKTDARSVSPVTDKASDGNQAAPDTTSACTTPRTSLTSAQPWPREDSGGAIQEVMDEKGVKQEALVDDASGTQMEPGGDGLREVCIGS